jgi:hypothetical protein
MKTRNATIFIILATSFMVFFPAVYAEPSVNIIMEKTTYSYCEKLFYIIEVSEITGESAIIHIRDETGKGSSAIPIPITNLQNPIPSLIAFEKEVFPLGKYFVDIEYSGAEFTAEFNLIDSNKICIPGVITPILTSWLSGNISDGFMMDAFQKYVEKEIIDIPFEINEDNVYGIDIPDWVKNVGYWWIEDKISDEDFAEVLNYLIDEQIISILTDIENEI